MSIADLDDVTSDLSGTYLKKSDLEEGPLTFQIAGVTKQTFDARNGRPAEFKWVLSFAGEPPRKMTLNKTNLSLLAKAFGKKPSAWTGKVIDVELDESVSFGGQLVGGLRVRIPKRRKPTDDDSAF